MKHCRHCHKPFRTWCMGFQGYCKKCHNELNIGKAIRPEDNELIKQGKLTISKARKLYYGENNAESNIPR